MNITLEGKKGDSESKNRPLVEPNPSGDSSIRILEISRIGSNPKATMLKDETVLQLAVVYKDKPVISDLVNIYQVLKAGLIQVKSDRVKAGVVYSTFPNVSHVFERIFTEPNIKCVGETFI